MSLDRKIYLATALAAVVVGSALAIAAPRLAGGVTVHVGSVNTQEADSRPLTAVGIDRYAFRPAQACAPCTVGT